MRGELKRRVDLLNQELGGTNVEWQNVRSNDAVIIANTTTKASISFNPERYEINCMIVSMVEKYTAKIVDGKLYFYESNSGSAWPSDSSSVGRNPLAGLAASFAAVSAVFSVNIIPWMAFLLGLRTTPFISSIPICLSPLLRLFGFQSPRSLCSRSSVG
jgi:AbgT putative transporter family